MDFFLVKKVLQGPLAPRSVFTPPSGSVIALGYICWVPLLVWSISWGALAQDIPSGFKVERYALVWERNPFFLQKPAALEKLPPAFGKLFLASWLKDGGAEVVLVQNSETNEVQRITAVPNQNNLRLLEMYSNSNPQLVEVVISDGKEQGTVKFRFDGQPSTGEMPLAMAGKGSNQMEIAGRRGIISQAGPPSSQSPDSLSTVSNQVPMHRIYPGALRVHHEGGSGLTPSPQTIHRKHFSLDSGTAQLTSGQN